MELDYHKGLHVRLPEITEVKDNDQSKIPTKRKGTIEEHLSKLTPIARRLS